MRRIKLNQALTYILLTIWSVIVLFPIWTLIINSFKPQKEIFKDPFGFPKNFTFDGYIAAWNTGRFDLYFKNTLIVTALSLTLILLVGSMAAYASPSGSHLWRISCTSFLSRA